MNRRRRPSSEAPPMSFPGDETTVPEAPDLELLDTINTAWIAGYDIGYAHGRNGRLADAEAVRLHEAAAEVVLRMADLPEAAPPHPRRDAERARLTGRAS